MTTWLFSTIPRSRARLASPSGSNPKIFLPCQWYQINKKNSVKTVKKRRKKPVLFKTGATLSQSCTGSCLSWHPSLTVWRQSHALRLYLGNFHFQRVNLSLQSISLLLQAAFGVELILFFARFKLRSHEPDVLLHCPRLVLRKSWSILLAKDCW